jgi:peroxiredoxin
VPRLYRAQELLYRGSFTEEYFDSRVRLNRAYRLEARVFVLDTPPRGLDVALLTILKSSDPNHRAAPTVSAGPAGGSVRLERARVDLQGKVSADPGTSLAVPLEGAPTLECGMFVEVPGRVGPGQTWQTAEEGRPPCAWEAVGPEMVRGTSCFKLVGVQQSDDWGRPRADRAAWRRTDTVWVEPRLGVAYRVERVIERCEPAHREPTQRSVLRYERDFIRQLAGTFSDDCREEIRQALAFRDRAAPLLTAPARYAAPQLTALLNKINAYLEHQPETPPYREAVLQVKRLVEAARRGEAPPVPVEERPVAPAVATVGLAAPDFLVANLTGPGSARLRQWLGRPVLLVFYHPASPTAADLLRYAQRLKTTYGERIAVLGMSVSGDVNLIQRQRSALGLTFPVLNGSALRTSYAVETPKIVLLDAAGVVRGEYLGWGRETPGAVREDLKTWLSRR